MFKKTLLALAVASVCSACSVLADVAGYGAEANDKALKASEFAICKGASVGAVMRRYNTEELVEAWRKLCLNDAKNTVMGGDDG